MAAKNERARRFAGEGCPAIAGGIEMMFDGQFAELGLKPGACPEPGGSPGKTLGAVLVTSEGAEFFEQVDGALRINRHGDSLG